MFSATLFRTMTGMRHAVILAGGGGTRLWPASRRAHPKQFLSLGTGADSLLAATARRLRDGCEDRCYVVTANEQRTMVQDALPALPATNIIAEPSARNTAAALGLAAVHLLHRDPHAVMAAIPSDQHIANEAEFARIVNLAFAAAEERDAVVTVGIVPKRPETGYGYLELGPVLGGELREVKAFVEKPDTERAEAYLASGNYLWNGGMFFAKAQYLMEQIRSYMPETAEGLQRIADALGTESAQSVCDAVYPTLPSISIDYGVMEHTSPVLTIAGDFGWNDVGAWTALPDYRPADRDGNVIVGKAITHDAHNNIIVADEGKLVAVAGVSDMIVVQSGDALLILPRDRAQDVRVLVDSLRGELKDFL